MWIIVNVPSVVGYFKHFIRDLLCSEQIHINIFSYTHSFKHVKLKNLNYKNFIKTEFNDYVYTRTMTQKLK